MRIASQDAYLALDAQRKLSLAKRELASEEPDKKWKLADGERKELARWLASRYNRASFPNDLVGQLNRIYKEFKKSAEQHGQDVLGIYMAFDPPGELESPGEECYELSITVVYDAYILSAVDDAENLRTKIEEMFRGEFFDGEIWVGIELNRCIAVPDTDFTLREVRTSFLYNFDYVSFASGLSSASLQRTEGFERTSLTCDANFLEKS